MERICEPELMDEPAQARAYANADFTASDQALVERIVELFGTGAAAGPEGVASGTEAAVAAPARGLGQRIVDLGCGPGNITLLLAARFPAAIVLGLDGAAAMLTIAEERRRALAGSESSALGGARSGGAATGDRLRFQQAVLPLSAAGARSLLAAASGANAAGFSAVVSNSLLHHLHDPGVLWRTVHQLAAPGAAIYLQDLRRPASAMAADALVASDMASAPGVLRRDYRQSLQAAFTREEVEAQLRQAGLWALRVQERGERYLEVWGRLPLTTTSAA